ncbi:MAG: hypothetical protein HY788_13260 [Deltaproteobacteria bacterium]|nr:hypothetical protein [Deltaproteobacteria bacterium]
MNLRTSNRSMLLLICFVCAFALSCDSHERLAGTYEARVPESSTQDGAYFELKEGGAGLWVSGDQEVEFKWEARNAELRLNTRGGGVLVGRIKGDLIEIKLPGAKVMVFKKKG